MRISRLFDEGGGYDAGVEEPQETFPETAPSVDLGVASGSAPSAPPPPTGGTEPGPAPSPPPAPSGNPPPPRPPVPPAVPSAVKGIESSEATGGVRGSFGQAGDIGFSKRFGTPASWFKGAGQVGGRSGDFLSEIANKGRGVLGRGQAGSSAGGGTPVPVVAGPSAGLESGGANDEQWQRILAEVLKQRFGGG